MNITEQVKNAREQDATWLLQSCFDTGLVFGLFQKEIVEFSEKSERALSISANQITLNGASREELMTFLQIFGGKWEKEVNTFYPDKIDYSQDRPHPFLEHYNIKITATQVEPPPSCKIVEEEIEVPARKEKRKRIVCPEPTPDEIETVITKEQV